MYSPEVVSSEAEAISQPDGYNQIIDVVLFSKEPAVDPMLAHLVVGFGPSMMEEPVVSVCQDETNDAAPK